MLHIGPTIYSHTPHSRVHNAFPPLFDGAIRVLALPRLNKTTVFSDVSRVRIAPSPLSLRWLLKQSHLSLFLFEPLNLSLDDLADECGAALFPDEIIDPLAHPFWQSDDGGFHL